MTRPMFGLSPAPTTRTSDLKPLGGDCEGHSSVTVDGRCYWHAKVGLLSGENLSLEARQFCGYDIPAPRPPWHSARGWRSAEDLARTLTARALDEYDALDGSVRFTLSPETLDDLQALVEAAPEP